MAAVRRLRLSVNFNKVKNKFIARLVAITNKRLTQFLAV